MDGEKPIEAPANEETISQVPTEETPAPSPVSENSAGKEEQSGQGQQPDNLAPDAKEKQVEHIHEEEHGVHKEVLQGKLWEKVKPALGFLLGLIEKYILKMEGDSSTTYPINERAHIIFDRGRDWVLAHRYLTIGAILAVFLFVIGVNIIIFSAQEVRVEEFDESLFWEQDALFLLTEMRIGHTNGVDFIITNRLPKTVTIERIEFRQVGGEFQPIDTLPFTLEAGASLDITDKGMVSICQKDQSEYLLTIAIEYTLEDASLRYEEKDNKLRGYCESAE